MTDGREPQVIITDEVRHLIGPDERSAWRALKAAQRARGYLYEERWYPLPMPKIREDLQRADLGYPVEYPPEA